MLKQTKEDAMNYFLSILFFCFMTLPLFATNVTITFTNIRVASGTIVIGVYDNSADFPKDGEQMNKITVPVDGKSIKTTLTLPPGEYAFAVCHDEDGDGTCNQNLLGIPTEGFAFSNNVKPKLRAPNFDDVKIKVQNQNLNLSLKLIYF